MKAKVAVVHDPAAVERFTVTVAGGDVPGPFAVFVRDDGAVAAGARGWTWDGWCELVSIWVSEAWRGREAELERSLLAAVEEEARARGCSQVVLFADADEGPPLLYTSAGYVVVGETEISPAGGSAYWLQKRLDRRPGDVTMVLLQAAVRVGIGVLLVAEVAERVGLVRRRASRWITEEWASLERRQRQEDRWFEVSAMAGLLEASGAWHGTVRSFRSRVLRARRRAYRR